MARLVLGLSLLLAAAALGSYLLLSRSLSEIRWAESDARLRSQAVLLEDFGVQSLAAPDPSGIQEHVQQLGKRAGIRITLIHADGSVLADSDTAPDRMDNLASRPEIQESLSSEFGSCRRYSPPLGVDFVFVARALRREGQLLGWIRVSVAADSIAERDEATLSTVARQVAISGLAALVLGIAAIYWFAGRKPAQEREVS